MPQRRQVRRGFGAMLVDDASEITACTDTDVSLTAGPGLEGALARVVRELYGERTTPHAALLQWRLLAAGRPKLSAQELLAAAQAAPGLRISPEAGRKGLAWIALLTVEPPSFSGFADDTAPLGTECDTPSPTSLLTVAACYLLEGGWRTPADARHDKYAIADWLKKQDRFPRRASYGQVLRIVRHFLCGGIQVLGKRQGRVVPYPLSEEFEKRHNARLSLPTGVREGEAYVKDWEDLRELLTRLLLGSCDQIRVSSLKLLFRQTFQVELSETALGHASLMSLLSDARLTATIALEGWTGEDLCLKFVDGGATEKSKVGLTEAMGASPTPQPLAHSPPGGQSPRTPDVWANVWACTPDIWAEDCGSGQSTGAIGRAEPFDLQAAGVQPPDVATGEPAPVLSLERILAAPASRDYRLFGPPGGEERLMGPPQEGGGPEQTKLSPDAASPQQEPEGGFCWATPPPRRARACRAHNRDEHPKDKASPESCEKTRARRPVLSLEHFLPDAVSSVRQPQEAIEGKEAAPGIAYISTAGLACSAEPPDAGLQPVPALPALQPEQPRAEKPEPPAEEAGAGDCRLPALAVGQPVMARFLGEWHLATVRRVDGGTVEVDWPLSLTAADVEPVPPLGRSGPAAGTEREGALGASSEPVADARPSPLRVQAHAAVHKEDRQLPYGLPSWCTVRRTFVEACSPEAFSTSSMRCCSAPPSQDMGR